MILKNIKIINHNITIDNSDIEIEDGFIKKIIEKKGHGSYVAVPGFIDSHIHGFAGYDSMDGTEAIESISKALGKLGTTAIFPTLMTSSFENILDKISQASKAKSLGSQIVGIHLEGPYISHEKKGAHDEMFIKKASDDEIKKLIKFSKNKLKKITIAPESFPIDKIKMLIQSKVIPSLGHSNTNAKTAQKYIQKGAISTTHIWNAMSGVENRNPGLAEASLNSDQVYVELICDLIHVDEDAIRLTIKAKGANKIITVTDSIRPAGLEDGNFQSGGLDITKKGKVITLKNTSTIAGSGATMLDNFKTLVKLGYPLQDVVAMTSYNASLLFNLIDMGKIQEGMQANINILNKKGDLEKVFIKGVEQ